MSGSAPVFSAPSSLRFHFSVEDYYHMAEAGILPQEGGTELLEGEIYFMSPVKSTHAGMVNKLNRLLNSRLRENEYLVTVQNPILLNDFSEPEPDLCVAQFRSDFYQNEHPTPSDILLIIEVSDTSLYKDQNIKLPLYAIAEIPEVWIVNLENNTIEVYTSPADDAYGQKAVFHPQDTIHSPFLGDIQATGILG